MEQHAVPRQITSFEFKLIGFLTIKQFVYLLLFAGFSVLIYFLLLPIKPFNIVLAGLTMAAGGFFAMYRYNERELDVWIKNLATSLLSPSQYYYMKRNTAPDFLKGVFVSGDETTTLNHVDANQKLAKYLETKKHEPVEPAKKALQINTLLQEPATPVAAPPVAAIPVQPAPTTQTTPGVVAAAPVVSEAKEVCFSGVIHNNRNEPLPNIMVYVNSSSGQAVRILKTNHHGLFATFHPLPPGDYAVNPKDLGGKYFFDTMNITVDEQQLPPIQIYSKEVL